MQADAKNSVKALLVVDVQNDYFPDGHFPLWNAEETLANIESAIAKANSSGIHVILIQHIANTSAGPAPFFNKDTKGVEIHPKIIAAAPTATIVVKEFADSFVGTTLEENLSKLGVTELFVCGMMTQNCVTHTAISKSAEKYDVSILMDCCTTVSEILHKLALHGVSTRTKLAPWTAALV